MATARSHDVVRCGPELLDALQKCWLSPAAISKPLVVLVHGFTAHGDYLAVLAQYLGASGRCQPALFNYDSHRGIDHAAESLAYLLDGLGNALAHHGCVLVGHSMGGLVCRYFAEYGDSPSRRALRGIATLGTPHSGALSRHVLTPLLDWADDISVPNPFARSLACRASVQLTDSSTEGLVGRLNAMTRERHAAVPLLSLSGGLPYLQFCSSNRGFAGTLRNLVLQMLIGERPNDGLVAESSSDVTRAVSAGAQRSHSHDYPAYETTNHTHLVQNQQIAMVLQRWIDELLAPERSSM